MRKKYSAAFKFKVALESFTSSETILALSQHYGVAESLVHKWRKQLKEQGAALFEKEEKSKNKGGVTEHDSGELYEQIGRLKVENEFLKKSLLRV